VNIAVYHNLPSGGAKRALYEMVRRLCDDHRVDVYTLSPADHDFCDLRPFCNRHRILPFAPLPLLRRPFGRLNQGSRTLDLLRLHALQRRLAREINTRSYDVLFVHHCQFERAPSLLQFSRTPAVYYCQEPPRLFYEPRIPRSHHRLSTVQRLVNCVDPFPILYRAVLLRRDRASVRSASGILVNSAYSRESFYRIYGLFAAVCYLGVDTHRFSPLPVPRKDYVLSVGVLDPRKGFDFLVHSLALIDEAQRPPLVLVNNAGDDRERRYLQTLAQRLRVSISFRTLVSDEELVHLYSQAALTLYAPIMEPFGFVPVESMACGTPVIGVREGGVRESVVHGVTGLLVDRDPVEAALAVRELLADEERLNYYGREGREHVLNSWTWDRTAAQLEQTLSEAAGGSRRAEI
jgi:glycosyltransferase involved in cell wall biosynthesis